MTTASIGTPPPAADRPRAKVIVSRETSTAPDASVSTSTRIIGSLPSCSRRSTTAGAASAPLPRIWTLLGCGGGRSSRTRLEPRGSAAGVRLSISTFFAFIRPGTVG